MSVEASFVVAVVPAYQCVATIVAVVAGARAHVESVLVVDDGSTDGTAEAASRAGAEVLRRVANGGKGAAIRDGLARVLADPGVTHVLFLDGDGQHDPAEIPGFLGAYSRRTIAGAPTELIIGQRAFSAMPPIRRAANILGRVSLSAALGRWIPDNQSG
jgi:glycosyltransferase involved in cell wall biosynthesis